MATDDGLRNRSEGSTSKREYTQEQHEAVKRVLKCKVTAYYEILKITAPSHETEIKRSYRRLALTMHPDKNAAPQADEAFKRISKAFQVLSDPDKKRMFDQTGQDPESRSAAAASGFSGFSSRAAGGPGGGIDPNDLFSAFFGGNMGRGGMGGMPMGGSTFSFGGGPAFSFQGFGGPGGMEDDIFAQLFGGGSRQRQRQRQQQQQQQQETGNWRQLLALLPILVVLVLPSLLSMFSGLANIGSTPAPKYRFDSKVPYTVERTTPSYHVPFYVRQKDVEGLSPRRLRQLDRSAENTFVAQTRAECTAEWTSQQELLQRAVGWFSTDQDMYEEALNMPLPHCKLLDSLGIRKSAN